MNARATQFHQLHQQGLLMLTNVGDATGARLKAVTYGEVNGLQK